MHLSLWNISDKYLTSFDSDVDINIKLSINFILYLIDLPLSSSSLTGTEKVIYFPVLSPKHSNWLLNSFASLLITKW